MEGKFYMVKRVGRGYADGPVEHVTAESAAEEANRLAGLHPGELFVVLEAVASFRVNVSVEKVNLCQPIPLPPRPYPLPQSPTPLEVAEKTIDELWPPPLAPQTNGTVKQIVKEALCPGSTQN